MNLLMQPNMQEALITNRPNSFSVNWILYVAGIHTYSYHRRIPGTVTYEIGRAHV